MKKLIIYCLLVISVSALGQPFSDNQQKLQEVNPILHDESYLAAFGVLPDGTVTEQLRIQTHLYYAETLLRSTSQSNLTNKQKANRLVILDLLHEYLLAGKFPANNDHPGERRPCFIDAGGNICAVGYLVEQTKGRGVAEAINKKHQYDFLLDMHEPIIEEWVTEYGFTLEECAMIQPAYGPPPAPETVNIEIKTGYGVSSGIVGGSNVALTAFNLASHGKGNAALAYIGMISGAGQIIMGATNIKKSTTEYRMNGGAITSSYREQNNLSYVNIALGAATLVSSTLNLIINHKSRNNRNAVNLYSYPVYDNAVVMGLSFTRSM